MKRTIRKVLEELQKENPDLSYIRGMLEVLVDEDELAPVGNLMTHPDLHKVAKEVVRESGGNVTVNGESVQDEGKILDSLTKARIGRVREMANKSTEIS